MPKSNQSVGLPLYAQAIAAVPDAVFVFDGTGRFVALNQLACESVGYSRAVLLRRSVSDIVPDLNLSKAQRRWQRLEPGRPLQVFVHVRHRSGSDFPAEVRLGLLVQDGQRLYVATARDLSPSHALQNALRLSEERFQQATRAAHFGFFVDNLLTSNVHWSKEFRHIVGVAADAHPASSSVLCFVHPDDQEFVQIALQRAQNPTGDGKLDSIHRLIRQGDGVLRWVQVIGKVMFAGQGAQRYATEVNGLLLDITDHMQAKQDLLISQQRFEFALTASPIVLFEQDTDLRYTWHCNSNLGYSSVELLGKTDAELMDAESAQKVQALKQHVLRTGASLRQEISVLRRDGSLAHIDVSLRVRRDAEGKIIGIMGTGFDVTEVRNANIRLEALNAEMKLHSLEVESVNTIHSRFLSTVSHELRTPLHTLLGYVRLAMLASHGEVREHLQIVERSGRQLLKQIGDLLSFNRLDKELGTLQPEGVELRTVIEQIERTGRLLVQAGNNQFLLDLAPDLPGVVRMDEYRLMQVLDNLISNACKFTRSGVITLRVQREPVLPGDAPYCRLLFSVADSGTGIALKDLSKIFDPFVRLEKNPFSPGLGLGLSIARQWIRAMGSDIHVESTPGKGSRFFFTLELPEVARRTPADVSACERFSGVLSQRVFTLLVVDDLEESRQLLRQVCTQWGYAVEEAEDVPQAMQLLREMRHGIHGILVDQFMPGCTGWELLQQVRAMPMCVQIPIVLVSASDPQRPPDFPSGLEFDLVMGKPLDYEVLACFLCQSLALVECSGVDYCSATEPPPEPPPEAVLLGAADLHTFRQLLLLGRVVRIAQWAEELARRDAHYQDFSAQVVRLALAADLLGLERLAQRAEADPRRSLN